MKTLKYGIPLLSFFLLWSACTPKVTETTSQTTTPVATQAIEVDEALSACKNWKSASNKDEIMTAHVLYKDRFREIKTEQKLGAKANTTKIDSLYQVGFDYWQYAFAEAPAADGKRADHFEDGIKFYEYFLSQTTDATKKERFIDTIMTLYDERAECYGEEGYIIGRKAFDYYYKYSDMATDLEKYAMFKKAIDMGGEDAPYFILNPFTALLSNLLIEEKIPMTEGQEYQQKIRNVLSKGLSTCENDKECEPWKIVDDYAPKVLEQLEGIKGFYDCNYFKDKYYSLLEESPNDCDVIISVLSRLKWGGCLDNDPQLVAANAAYATHCSKPAATVVPLCREYLRNGDYTQAISCYEEKAESSTDAERKAQYYLVIAKIYYGELKRFGKSRKYARLAAQAKSNWGDPYLLIGKLYASSGPLCGPGRGWDSQIVTWPAIDQWNKAKRVDPSVASEANRLINRYQQYMPDIEDLFIRGYKNGDAFKVGCWIQENTKVRASK